MSDNCFNPCSGISSFIFAKNGQGFYLSCSSEFCRTSLSKRYVTQPQCTVELQEGMRPEPEPEEPKTDEAAPEASEEPAEQNTTTEAPQNEQ